MLHLHYNARRLHDLRLVTGVTGFRIADRHQGAPLQREVNQGHTVPIRIGTRYVGSPLLARVFLQCFDQVACVHMSGPLSRSHMNARQDGFRDATSKYAVPVVRPRRRVSYNKNGCGDTQPPIPTFADGWHLRTGRCAPKRIQLGSPRISVMFPKAALIFYNFLGDREHYGISLCQNGDCEPPCSSFPSHFRG
jgi:hypothetical protein